jgi:hypothetical protein
MARESVDIQELLRVQPNDLLEALSQENGQLRLELMAQKAVINRLVASLQELSEDSEENDED